MEINNNMKKIIEENNFELKRSEEIIEYGIKVYDMIHKKCKARYIHFESDDRKNNLCISFKTPSFDSSGLQHILEHLSLCGSKNFPCKDPFFKMFSRSTATFMNAMTFPEHTSYPFITSNEKDFYNLAHVYCDAVLYPLLRPLDFLQEGWRLEYKEVNDKSTPIIIKGVVYNEMKGVYSSYDNILMYSFIKNILPISYPHENGGYPIDIPKLNYDSIKNYHEKYYHPSNSLFLTYGNFKLHQHLQFLNNILNNYDEKRVDSSVQSEPDWTETRYIKEYGPLDPLICDQEKQTSLTVGYKIKSTDQYSDFVLEFISKLLLDGPNAPFYESLIKPHIGLDFSPVSGFNNYTKHRTFAVGLKGIHQKDIKLTQDIIDETFNNVASRGFDSIYVDNLIKSLELKLKHISPQHGFNIIRSASNSWSHDFCPVETLRTNQLLEKLKFDLRDKPTFLQDFIKCEIINNTHKIIHQFTSDPLYEERMQRKYDDLIEQFTQSLTSDQKQSIFDQGQQLFKHQEQMKSADIDSCLPQIHLINMDKTQYKYEIINSFAGASNVPVQFCIRPTNNITYFKAVIDISSIPIELKPYVLLFCNLLTEIGAGNYDEKELESLKKRTLRDMSANIHIIADCERSEKVREEILLKSYCLNSNIPQMFSIWIDIFNSPHLHNKDVILTKLLEISEKLSSYVLDSAHKIATINASSNVHYFTMLRELYEGCSQVKFLKNLNEKKDIEEISQKLHSIASIILNNGNIKCAINTTADNVENVTQELGRFVDCLHTAPEIDHIESKFELKTVNHFLKMPFDVNYVGMALPGIPLTHPDYACVKILSSIVTSKYLIPEVREKGGAYGSGMLCERHLINLYSYRDPNIISTIDIFKSILNWIQCDSSFSEKDLEETKVKLISKLDVPLSPCEFGMELFLDGISHEYNQTLRDRYFEVNRSDIINAAIKYILINQASITVIGKDYTNLDSTTWLLSDFTK